MQQFLRRKLLSLVNSSISRQMSVKKDHLDVTAGQFRHNVITPAVVAEKNYISPTVCSLIMKIEDRKFGFYAGQWVDFAIPDTNLVGGYSMCSSPGELRDTGTLELAVKRSSWPPAVWVHQQCEVGSRVTLKAGGDFWFHPDRSDRPRPLLLVAGGVGINPLVSILRHCRDLRRQRRLAAAGYAPAELTLLYSASTPDELIFRDCIAEMENEGLVTARFFVTRSDSCGDHNYINRRMGETDLQEAVTRLGADPLCYLCGPSRMIADVERWLLRVGVPKQSVLYERWW